MNNQNIEIIDFGCGKYSEILEIQTELFNKLVKSRKEGDNNPKEFILIGEHYPVITCGRHANESNILYSIDYLAKNGIEKINIGRGGDVTYHCPGQLIVYPILDLRLHKLGVKSYVNLLEESVIILLRKYGILGERIEGATGVWIDKGKKKERKISAIGIKCSHFCTMHGLSLNVNSDLKGFSFINPCGFKDKGVTSISLENGKDVEFQILKKEFLDIFLSLIFPLKEVFNFSE